MALDDLSALIVNPDLPSRTRLREILKAFAFKGSIANAQGLNEASEKVKLAEDLDAVFISSDFPEADIASFLQKVKSGKSSPSLILTLRANDRENTSKVTTLYLHGVQGFIAEPFSTDDVRRLVELVEENRAKQDALQRVRKATSLLAQDAASRINEIAKRRAAGVQDGGPALKELRRIHESLKVLEKQDSSEFFRVLVDHFESIPPPQETAGQKRRRKLSQPIVHPSAVVRQLITDRNLSLDLLKSLIKVEWAEFEEFLAGKRGVDDFISRELSRVFGRTSRDWLKMQKVYDLEMEKLQGNREE